MVNTITKYFLILMVFLPVFSSEVAAVTSDEAVIDELVRVYRLDTNSCTVEVLSNRLKCQDIGPGELSIRPLTEKEPLGLFTVMATVTQDGETFESSQVRLKIRKFADVLVTTDKVKMHGRLTENNVALKRMEVTTLTEKPLVDPKDLVGFRLKRNLRRGTILVPAAIEPIPDIEAGKEVSIVYTDGLCQISTTGVVMESGMAGEYIKVKNKTSSKIILARVVDGGVVAIDP